MKTIAIKIKSQAQANQLASLVHSNDVRTIDQEYVWNGTSGEYLYTHRPFVVGNTALFWLYPSNTHFSQYTSKCTDATLDTIPAHQYGTVNDLAEAFQIIG